MNTMLISNRLPTTTPPMNRCATHRSACVRPLGVGKMISPACVLATAMSAITTTVQAESTTVPFDGGVNTGAWTWGTPTTYPQTGGNPDAYMRTTGLDTFAPQLRTQGPSVFTGDYREKGVVSLGVDLVTFAVDFSAAERPLALMLVNDNGTPGNPNDDWAAYTLGPDIPVPGQPWTSYDFEVPSQATELPPGWAFIELGPGAQPDWDAVITNVSRVNFFYGDPEFFFIFQMWTLGADNLRIVCDDSGIPGDLNGDGVVDGADLGILLAAWGSADPAADLNGDGVVDGADLGALLAAWTAA